jgi:N-dimethylarginine dimethylaminohydrolase
MKKQLTQRAMCPPNYFGVTYEINPWMQGNIGQVNHGRAAQQWQWLYEILSKQSTVHLIPAVKNLPDLCFTANAGLIYKQKFILSHFKFIQRQAEEPHFLEWFSKKGYNIHRMPEEIYFEGEGDALFQPGESLLWLGYGMRTDIAADALIRDILKIKVHALHLIHPHFYHLDTCFVPLPDGKAIYYPEAFDAGSLEKLRQYFPAEKRYEVDAEDASNFACNAIIVNDTFICNQASGLLQKKLNTWGLSVVTTPLSEFMLAGGGAKCLVLNLPSN